MIRDREYEKDIINIVEVNSGLQDHKDFKRVLSDLMILIKDKFSSLDVTSTENIKLEYPLKFIKYREIPVDPSFVVQRNLTVKFIKKSPLSEKFKNVVILEAGSYLDNGKLEIVFDVNKYSTVNDILNSLDKLEEYLSHELTHIFKHLYGQYQKTMADYKKKNNNINSTELDDWYWTNKHEIQAYITQINTQLKNIKKINPNIKFKDAILQTDGYKLLDKFLPLKTKKYILHDVLRKTVNYWINTVGGKINEFRIKLK